MSDMDSRLRQTFRTFTDAELVDMVLDHSGAKSPKSQRLAAEVLKERKVQPLDYPGIIEEAERSGELARLASRPAPMPRSLQMIAWAAALCGTGLGYWLTAEPVLALFLGALAGVSALFVARAARSRLLHRRGLGHALNA
jgi:hypothetical protein